METKIKATVTVTEEKHFIQIEEGEWKVLIPISEDKSNEVKSAFNKLIKRMKDGSFQIVLENVGDDLFSQVANEYLIQLNKEILEVYGEMKRFGLCKMEGSLSPP